VPATLAPAGARALVREELAAGGDALETANRLVDILESLLSSGDAAPPDIRDAVGAWAVAAWLDGRPDLADALATLVVNAPTPSGRALLESASLTGTPAIRAIAADALRDLDNRD
jgi:hypothetical protein